MFQLSRGALISIGVMLLLLVFFSLALHVATSEVATVAQTFQTKYRPALERGCEAQTHSGYQEFLRVETQEHGQRWLVECADGSKIHVNLPS